MQSLTLANNASVGGTFRFDLRQNSARPALNLGGYTLTKTGANELALVDTLVTPGAGNIDIAQGIFSIQTTTAMGGSSANKINVRNGATLETYQSGTWTAPTWTVEMDAGSSFTSISGTTPWAGPVILNGAANLGGSATLTLNGAITGASGSLNKNGAGTLILGSTAGANTYGGGTTITSSSTSSSTLQLGANDQIPDGSLLTFTGGSGSGYSYLNLQGFTETVGGISDSTTHGVIQNSQSGGPAATTLTVNNSADYSYNGRIRDNASGTSPLGLTKQGGGKLTLSGTEIKYTGATTISGGTLTLDGTTAFASDITDNGALELNLSSGTWALSKAISGTGSVTKSGAGTVTLSGGNSYQGPTTISAGTLSVGLTGHLGSSAASLVFDGGTLQITGTTLNNFSGIGHTVSFNAGKNVGLDINNSANTFTADQVLNQTSGGLTKAGAGTLILNQANTYSGATSVSTGIVRAEHNSALGSGNVNVANQARLALGNGITVSGQTATISGDGRAGSSTEFNGALQSASGANEWAGNVVINAASTRIGAVGGSLKVSGQISSGVPDTGLFVRIQNGASVELSGVNTYSGNTTIVTEGAGANVKLSGGANRLPVGSKLILGVSTLSGIFDLNGQNQEVAGLSIAGTGTANEIKSASAATLTVNTVASSPSTFPGLLSGSLGLEKKRPGYPDSDRCEHLHRQHHHQRGHPDPDRQRVHRQLGEYCRRQRRLP